MAAPSYPPSPTPVQQNHPGYTDFRAASSPQSDISPPDSPAGYYGHRHMDGSPDISPVDGSPISSQYQLPLRSKYNSNIPLPLKTHSGAKGFLSQWGRGSKEGSSPSERDSIQTRWDDFSGEPTTSEHGKPAQATPSNAPFSAPLDGRLADPGFGVHTSISGGSLNSHAAVQNASGASRNFSGGLLGSREAWKGASGRSALVSPIIDKLRPASKAIPLPARRPRPASPVRNEQPAQFTPSPMSGRADQSQGLFDASTYDGIIKPIVPLKAGRNSPPRSLVTKVTEQTDRPYPSPAVSEARSPAAWSVSSESVRNKPLPTPTESTPSKYGHRETDESNEREFLTAMNDMNLSNEPGSRFSATTYATTTYESPPDTPRMDSETPMPSPLSPLMNRKRPLLGESVSSAKSTTRKPTPSERGSSPRLDSSRFSKTLPQSPAEKESVDRISSLLASVDNLHRRRLNLQTVIHELTQVVQPSTAAYDMASRAEIKKTVKALEAELAGVIKDEHETGMKLHRAYKKRDKEDIWEPTGLWVRRVTG